MSVRPISHAMTTTAPAIEGYRATKTLGVVRGLTARSRSVTEVLCYVTAVILAPIAP